MRNLTLLWAYFSIDFVYGTRAKPSSRCSRRRTSNSPFWMNGYVANFLDDFVHCVLTVKDSIVQISTTRGTPLRPIMSRCSFSILKCIFLLRSVKTQRTSISNVYVIAVADRMKLRLISVLISRKQFKLFWMAYFQWKIVQKFKEMCGPFRRNSHADEINLRGYAGLSITHELCSCFRSWCGSNSDTRTDCVQVLYCQRKVVFFVGSGSPLVL